MSDKSSSSSSDEDVDPESGQPLELGGVLSKVRLGDLLRKKKVFCAADIFTN